MEILKTKKISEINNISVKIGKLSLDRDSDFFPSRSDQKVMRDDVKMSIVTAQELLNKYNFSQKILSNIPLFVSNGSFLGILRNIYQEFLKYLKMLL